MGERIAEKISFRSYNSRDEVRILDFLNLCYGNWGDINEWRWRTVQCPDFENDNVVIAEIDGKIVGCGGLDFRDICIPSVGVLRTATIVDAAVHPDFRGRGIYARMTYDIRKSIAKSKGATLFLSHTQRRSVTHMAHRKRGFVEIHYPAFIKIINPKKVLKAELAEFLVRNKRFLKLRFRRVNLRLEATGVNICLEVQDASKDFARGNKLQITIDERALPLIIKLRASGKMRAMSYLLALLLFSRVRIKFKYTLASMKTFVMEGIRFVRYLSA